MILTKPVDLPQLTAELRAAGIDVPALGTVGDDLHTYDAAGAIVDLPEAAAVVVAAHVPVERPVLPTIEEQVAAISDALDAILLGGA